MNNHLGKMETIFNNPGLQHLAENVLWNLDVEHLQMCGVINKYLKQILENPMLWLEKFVGLSKENQQDWIKVIQLAKNSGKEKSIISYLQWNLKKDAMVDLPCYSNPAVQDDFRKEIWEYCAKMTSTRFCDEHIEMLKLLAPLTDKFNVPGKYGDTPISLAARTGHTEIVNILAHLTDNPNAPAPGDNTPIYWAAMHGYTEIVKILASVVSNPNAPNEYGCTPIAQAAYNGFTEIVKILAPLTNYPIAPNIHGFAPLYLAVYRGHTEIVRILAPLTDDHNDPNGTPLISITKNEDILRILKSVKTSIDSSMM